MKLPSKTVITLISIPVLILLFFSSNIYGYFRFKSYCSSESGLHVYEKLERNFGWLADSRSLAGDAAMLKSVAFGRYKDSKNNSYYDVKYLGGDVRNDSSYEYKEASTVRVIYELVKKVTYLDEENRIKKISYMVLNSSKKKLIEFNIIYYSAWGGALGGPDWVSCSPESEESSWKNIMEKSFKIDRG